MISMQALADGLSEDLPRICLGTSRLKSTQCHDLVAAAIDTGFRFFDTARSYENEAVVGQALRKSGLSRQDFRICTKVHLDAMRYQDVIAAISCSLQDLQTDYIDLLLIHWPSPDVPLEETLHALCQAKAAGHVCAIGVSNFPLAYLEYAVEICPDIRILQIESHPMLKEEEIVRYAATKGIVVMAYRPTGRGLVLDQPLIIDLAEKYGRSRYQIVLRWHLSRPGVIPVCGTSQIGHLEENFAAQSFTIDEADCRLIDGIGGNARTITRSYAPDWSSIVPPPRWINRYTE